MKPPSRLAATLTITCVAVLAAAPAALASSTEAACMGVLSSSLAGDAGERAAKSALIKELTSPQPPGTAYSFFAQVHDGTVAACHAAVEG